MQFQIPLWSGDEVKGRPIFIPKVLNSAVPSKLLVSQSVLLCPCVMAPTLKASHAQLVMSILKGYHSTPGSHLEATGKLIFLFSAFEAKPTSFSEHNQVVFGAQTLPSS